MHHGQTMENRKTRKVGLCKTTRKFYEIRGKLKKYVGTNFHSRWEKVKLE